MQDACHQNQVPESDFPKLFVAFLKRFRAKATGHLEKGKHAERTHAKEQKQGR